MTADRFQAIQVGDEAEVLHLITERDVEIFVGLTGDNNPLHVDEAYAAATPLKHRVVHGMLSASFISTLIGTKLPGPGALWYEQQLRFLLPVRIGEQIRVTGKVKHKSTAQRVLTISTDVYGGDGRRVIEGEAKVKVMLPNGESEADVPRRKGAVIISGSGRGIGAAIATELARAGYPVMINCLHRANDASAVAEAIRAQGGTAVLSQADVVDRRAVQGMAAAAIEQFGSISGVVNNASAPIANIEFDQISADDLQRHFDVQVKGALNLCQAVLPHMVERKAGVVVNIGSIVADNTPPTQLLHYAVSKAALTCFSRSLAVEYGHAGIRVNTVSPGLTQTDHADGVPEKARMLTRMQTPLRRLAAPEDIAGVVAFLFSERARHVTGQNLRVCGGLVMA